MTYASVSVDSQVWESKQPGKRSKRGAVAELSKEEGVGCVQALNTGSDCLWTLLLLLRRY